MSNFYDVARFLEQEIPIGQACKVDGMLIDDLPTHPMTREPGLHRLMSNLVGSGFGAWHITRHRREGTYTFLHREPNGKRVFFDWDRRPFGWNDSGWYTDDHH